MIKKFKALLIALIGSMVTVMPAMATPLTTADIWNAVTLDTIQENVFSLLIVMIGISLGFVAYRYIRSVLARARG